MLPKILHQMGLQMSNYSGDGNNGVIADLSCNWKRIENNRLEDMFVLGRKWEIAMPPEYVPGIKRALQSITNYHLRNIQLPSTMHRFLRLYLSNSCYHDASVCIKILLSC